MDIKKVKPGTLILIKSYDHFASTAGWLEIDKCLDKPACLLESVGFYLGVTKQKDICLAGMRAWGDQEELASDYGTRIYIPTGCVVSVRKL